MDDFGKYKRDLLEEILLIIRNGFLDGSITQDRGGEIAEIAVKKLDQTKTFEELHKQLMEYKDYPEFSNIYQKVDLDYKVFQKKQ